MNEFVIAGNQGFIRMIIDEALSSPKRGEVKGRVEIKSGSYYVKEAEVSFSAGQLLEFYEQLQKVYRDSQGRAAFANSEASLTFELDCNSLGQIVVQGHFQEVMYEENILQFEFESEHSSLAASLHQLKKMTGQ